MPNSPKAFFTLVFLLFIVVGCGEKEKKIQPPKPGAAGSRQTGPTRVQGFVVKPQTISEKLEVGGTLLANESTEIHPEISGRLVYLNSAEGKQVGKGTLIAKIYDGDLQAQLKKYEVQLQIAQQTEGRFGQLLKIQGISKEEYNQSTLQVNNIRADMDILRSSITKTQIYAPFSGRLGLKNISPGAYVSPATVISTIQQVSKLKLDFSVPEKYSGQIKTGQAITLMTEGNDKKYTAKVMATESSVTETTRSLMVRSVVQNSDASLLPGSFAKVILSFAPDPNALMVPSQAVLPQARGKKIIISDQGTAKFVEVTTGIRDSANVQITSGIKAGDTVVITGLLSLRPEGKIIVSKIVNESARDIKKQP